MTTIDEVRNATKADVEAFAKIHELVVGLNQIGIEASTLMVEILDRHPEAKTPRDLIEMRVLSIDVAEAFERAMLAPAPRLEAVS